MRLSQQKKASSTKRFISMIGNFHRFEKWKWSAKFKLSRVLQALKIPSATYEFSLIFPFQNFIDLFVFKRAAVTIWQTNKKYPLDLFCNLPSVIENFSVSMLAELASEQNRDCKHLSVINYFEHHWLRFNDLLLLFIDCVTKFFQSLMSFLNFCPLMENFSFTRRKDIKRDK